MRLNDFIENIFHIHQQEEFEKLAMWVFHWQYKHNRIYQEWCHTLSVKEEQVKKITQVPFLPISLFKTKIIQCGETIPDKIFLSSGTTQITRSKHYIKDIQLYERSFFSAFTLHYGNPADYAFIGLLPTYLENNQSSLIYMVNEFMQKSNCALNGYFLNNHKELYQTLIQLHQERKKTILFATSFALFDFALSYKGNFPYLICIDTGGMKSTRKEMVREEWLAVVKKSFPNSALHSEYSMTELLSQAYSKEDGWYHNPAWMQTYIRDPFDPFQVQVHGKGLLNIIDLANIWSVSFIATDDIAEQLPHRSFRILGRHAQSDIRGCSLLTHE